MNLLLVAIVLGLVWAAITGSFTALNLLFGMVIAGVALYLLRDVVGRPRAFRRLGLALSLAWLFLRELLVSALRVAMAVLSPDLKRSLRPAIVPFPLSVKSDAEIALLANLITLTPGTLSVDVSEDRKLLYVHVLALDDREALIADIANGFEAKVKAVFA